MEYPEEIYATRDGGLLTSKQRKNAGAGWGRRHAYKVGRSIGYIKGLTQRPDPLAGYSNLTEAIKSGEPIDWERLDGLGVKCVNPDMGELHGALERHGSQVVTSPFGWWWRPGSDYVYTITFISAWYGEGGWTLYVEGEIPTHRKTADQLKLGTYFLGKTPSSEAESWVYVGGWAIRDLKSIYHAPTMLKSPVPAEKWEVIEEYGPFQKPEDK